MKVLIALCFLLAYVSAEVTTDTVNGVLVYYMDEAATHIRAETLTSKLVLNKIMQAGVHATIPSKIFLKEYEDLSYYVISKKINYIGIFNASYIHYHFTAVLNHSDHISLLTFIDSYYNLQTKRLINVDATVSVIDTSLLSKGIKVVIDSDANTHYNVQSLIKNDTLVEGIMLRLSPEIVKNFYEDASSNSTDLNPKDLTTYKLTEIVYTEEKVIYVMEAVVIVDGKDVTKQIEIAYKPVTDEAYLRA